MTSAASASTARPAPASGRRLHPYTRIVLTIAAVGLAGFALGALTSPAQGFLPDDVQSFANSSSGWTLLAFGLVRLSRLRPLPAAFAGSLAFVLLVEGYGAVSALRGSPNGPPLVGFFTTVGLFAGLVVGASAALLRYGSPRWRALAVAPLTTVLLGEGVYGLTVVGGSTSPVYWTAIIVLGAGVTAWQLRRQRTAPWLTASVLALIALGATLFWIVYAQPWTAIP